MWRQRFAKDEMATISQNPPDLWPLAVIDFEASSLEDHSYPVEVGVALWRTADQPVAVWSSLIRPEREWRAHGRWSRAAQKVHGIRGAELAEAPEAATVVAELCRRLAAIRVAWCDGGPYDAYWNSKLFAAAARPCPFRLGDWHRMLTKLPAAVRETVLSETEAARRKHRAAADASVLVAALAKAMGSVDPKLEAFGC